MSPSHYLRILIAFLFFATTGTAQSMNPKALPVKSDVHSSQSTPGTVQIPMVDVPFSYFASSEAKKAFIRLVSTPAPELAGDIAERAFYGRYNDALAKHMMPIYPVQIAEKSAGAILVAETIVALRAAKLPLPAAVGFFSGTADFSTSGDSEQFLPKLYGKSVADNSTGYIGKTDLKDPRLSPLFVDLAGFPPTLCITGTRDIFLSQTTRFHLALLNAGVPAELVVFDGMPHAHWGWLDIPESNKALEVMARFFERNLWETVS
jgi:pimeloyl-ACP methyl ester carboxylesterase